MWLSQMSSLKIKIVTLLTCFIPFKKYRKFVRGIILFGIKNYLRVIKTDKCTTYPNYLSIAAIMKNEGDYIKEWLDFHLLVGVDRFYLYDNESNDNIEEILSPYIKRGVVVYVKYPGNGIQNAAYKDIVTKYKTDTKYMAFIDIDEFLVPVKHKSLKDFLKTLPFFSNLVVTWVVYGSSGKKKKEKGLVIERFKNHTNKNWGVKPIVNPRLVYDITNPHTFEVAGYYIDENGKKLGKIDQTNNPPSCELIRCNHYATKSYEEFVKRLSNGDVAYADISKSHRKDVLARFMKRDRNEVFDNIMDKYIDVLRKSHEK